jgi:diguanylate cyclase (GGDEF)-like protein/PAS domain S-box-containing protein
LDTALPSGHIQRIADEIDAVALELELTEQGGEPNAGAVTRLHALAQRVRALRTDEPRQALESALDLAEGVIAAIPDLLFEVARDGTYLRAWTKDEDLLIRSKAQLIGKKIADVFPPEQAAAAMRAIHEADVHGVTYGHTIQMDLPDGSRRWFEHSIAKKPGKTRRADTFLAISRDVSARVEAEQARDTAHARLLSVLQTIPDMVWLKDTQSVYLSCNPAFERFVGMSQRDIIGKTDADLFPADVAKVARAKDKEVIEARCICIYEDWVTWPSTGESVLFERRKVPVYDAQGNVTAVVGVARDMTERKLIEDRLARREREFRTLVEHSPDVVMRYDKDFRRLYVNPTFAALIRGGGAAVLGKKPSELPDAHHALGYEQKLREVFATGKEAQTEVRWEAGRQNKRSYYLVKLVPEFGADGTVESVLAVGRDISELEASREKIHRMAFYDPLTDLPNRTLFNERLRQTLSADVRANDRALAAVMMIDLDRFKEINDTMGHAVGDEMLREAAVRLRACIREADTVARLGGDEFAVLLPQIEDRSALEQIAARIIERFDERFLLSGRELFVSCSIGIALHPIDSVAADDLVKFADSAMYLAKRAGRRGFRFYSKALTADAAANLQMESALRRAVERGELELHFQPKVSLPCRKVMGSEALLRWKRPGAGFIPPDQFIPVAEQTGLIADLGEWVLREACRAAVEWNTHTRMPHQVAVNLSARQFQSQGFAQSVRDVLEETGCRADWIELEITESLLLEENDPILTTLAALKSMGLSIAIDDFGTGYSALSYLLRFPIDTLKIDKSFVQKLTSDRRHAELVKTFLSIARCFRHRVVAEGVETAEQAAFLEANGCDVAQGFLFSRPMPKAEMTGLLIHRSRDEQDA